MQWSGCIPLWSLRLLGTRPIAVWMGLMIPGCQSVLKDSWSSSRELKVGWIRVYCLAKVKTDSNLSLSLSLSLSPSLSPSLLSLSHHFLERYKPLLSTRHQLRFLDLQRDLLLEFHQDLANNWGAVSGNPLVPQAAAYINAANYIATVLRQWGETEVSQH